MKAATKNMREGSVCDTLVRRVLERRDVATSLCATRTVTTVPDLEYSIKRVDSIASKIRNNINMRALRI